MSLPQDLSCAYTQSHHNCESCNTISIMLPLLPNCRRPAGSAVETFHLEQLVLRTNRPGRLHTHVVCPGVLYGAGEADDQLHGLWKTAWEGQRPLQVGRARRKKRFRLDQTQQGPA